MTVAAPKAPPEDLARWRELVRQARLAAAGRASDPAPALNRAVKGVKNRVVPSGKPSAEDPAVRLVRAARRYLTETTAGRRDLQAELLARADALASVLGEDDAAVLPAGNGRARPEPGSGPDLTARSARLFGAPANVAASAARLPYRED